MRIGYCTNVHAGADWAQTRANLEQHAPEVKRLCSPNETMGIGLWLSAQSAQTLVSQRGVEAFRDWLAEAGLIPYTLNGFPYGDFHQPVVKHAVYKPAWWQDQRRVYTEQLAQILDQLLPAGEEGSISTLPIAWGRPMPSEENLVQAGRQLQQLANVLADLEQRSGRLIYVCLEPEPSCVFDTTAGAIAFFERYLLVGDDRTRVRRHIRICHDVCHAAVMFEDQNDVFRKFADAGILVGKVQISSAVRAKLDGDNRDLAHAQLRTFNEPRYLHQTVVRDDSGATVFYEDLPAALNDATPRGEWRVHFHVPIYLSRFDQLETSQNEILQCLAAAKTHSEVGHFEVETYAWGVLPASLQQPSLAAGIAEEMRWFKQLTA